MVGEKEPWRLYAGVELSTVEEEDGSSVNCVRGSDREWTGWEGRTYLALQVDQESKRCFTAHGALR